MQIEKILLPFDGSVYSLNATRYALNMAKLSGAHVTIVNCYEWRGNVSEVPDSLGQNLKVTAEKEAERVLTKAEEIFASQGVEYKLMALEGAAGGVLAKCAESKEYDLIIMGSHGHSDIAGLFLGSVTHKVLNKIYCPVLIVP